MTPSRDGLPYAPFYCEENVWHLARAHAFDGARAFVVFVSNAARKCVLFHQRAASDANTPVVWDYHVVWLVDRDGWHVWDLDSTLPLSTPASDYLDATFVSDGRIPAALAPKFRVVEAKSFVETFASDRSHMRRPDGSWHAPPPPWPAILADGKEGNLSRFVDTERAFVGEVLDLGAMRTRFGRGAD